MEAVKIDLSEYKSKKSTVYTGRTQGEQVRTKLQLDREDEVANRPVIFTIPEETTSFNPSFFLGLLYPSIKKLGLVKFKNKYSFEITTTHVEMKTVLENNLADGYRNAANALNNNYGFNSFFKKK